MRRIYTMSHRELVLGDGIYEGERSILTKHRARRTTSVGDRLFNAIVDLYRARVEHIMHEVRSLPHSAPCAGPVLAASLVYVCA